jgi:hypothetical protein
LKRNYINKKNKKTNLKLTKMKKTILILAVVLASLSTFGQNILGKWYGNMDIHGKQLKVVFHIAKTGTGYKATLDSPKQKSFGIPVTNADFTDSVLKLEIANAGIEYLGTLDNNYNFVGVIKQSGEVFPVVLTTDKTAKR